MHTYIYWEAPSITLYKVIVHVYIHISVHLNYIYKEIG